MVWSELVSNALQHGDTNIPIELGWSRNNQEIRFWVANGGQAIAPEKLDDLFQPFHLLHRPNARKGLGLSIVQRLVWLQGGSCGYERSAAGVTTVFFTLPASTNR
jgi:K+-sensing histidine kinase KdpD